MMKRGYLYMFLLSLCGLCFCTGCTENTMWSEGSVSEGLVLNLLANGEAVVAEEESVASDVTLRENVTENVDVFFFAADKKGEVARYYHKEVGKDGKVLLETGNWKSKFPEASYDIYVVANFHQYDDASTPETETDLSRIKTWTALVALSDTDPDIFKVENDKFVNEETYTGKKFMMDGKKEGWTPSEGTDETIAIDLARAAAKIVVNVSYTDDFLVEDREIQAVRKKLVRYAQDVRVLAEADPIPILDLYGDADGEGMSTSNHTEGSGVDRKDVLYAYSYPNEWGDNVADQETYILMNIPYTDNQGDLYQNYYKIPVRISNTAADLCLKRNTVYTINVTVDRVGNQEIDKPVELTPKISIAPWKSENVLVGGDTYKYLIVSEDEIEMHNVADTVVTFFSSSAITVTLDAAYYVDKSGNEISLKDNSSDWYSVDYDESALSGELKIHSEVPEIVTARYFTLTVTNGDGMEKTINVVQYPLEYISGVPGLYSYVEQYINNKGETVTVNGKWPDNLKNRYSADIREGLDGHIGTNPYMKSKFYWEGVIYRIDMSYKDSKEYNPLYVTPNTPADNNRMYLVQISSTSEKYTVARPKMEGTGVGSVTALGEENNRLVSPAFMLASNLGNIGDVNWDKARDNCKYYVEHSIYTVEKADQLEGKNYDSKGHRRFDDWRLPTYAELQIIAGYQSTQTVVMDSVLTDDYYWAADKNTYLKTADPDPEDKQIPTGTDSKSDGKVRCIRDVTPEDLKELRAHNIR